MATAKRLLDAIRRLPPKQRRQLVAALRPPRKTRRTRRASGARSGDLSGLLALVGIGHSEYTDVSSDKYKHLAQIYASQP